jgi:hypothetical protein
MPESDDIPVSWFKKVEPWFDRFLNLAEVSIVLLIALIVLVTTSYQIIWIIAACDGPTRQIRLTNSMKMLNDNWKVGLLLIVPLFFRTIRAFLERVEEFWGMKAPRTPSAVTSGGTNPQERPTEEEPTSNPEH